VRGGSGATPRGLGKNIRYSAACAGLGQILPVDGHCHSQSTQLPAASTTAAAFFEPRRPQTGVDEWV
jgi:hypothetical protein